MAPTIYGLTLLHPWARAIHSFGKDVENRTWHPSRMNGQVGMYLAIHGGVPPRLRGESEKTLAFHRQSRALIRDLIEPGHVPDEQFAPFVTRKGEQWEMDLSHLILPGIVAVARVSRVVRNHPSPWADQGQWHWELSDVLPLARPLSYVGSQGLWRIADPKTQGDLQDAWAEAHDGELPPWSF